MYLISSDSSGDSLSRSRTRRMTSSPEKPLPLELGDVFVAVKTCRRLLERLAADAGSQEDRVSPDDRRRPALAGHRDLPPDVLCRRPFHGHLGAGRDATHGVAAKPRPGFLGFRIRSRNRRCDERRDEQQKHSTNHAFEDTSHARAKAAQCVELSLTQSLSTESAETQTRWLSLRLCVLGGEGLTSECRWGFA